MLSKIQALMFLGLLGAVAGPVWSQAITGTLTDPTGAAVAGAMVEAASPDLIEQRRLVETDGAGRFSIINLQPGIYTVTITKAGFNTSKREGITLITDFTATVNVQLQLGATQETVTVEAGAPAVDVQAVATARIMTSEMVDALPTNRTLNSLLNLVPGGGSGAFGNPQFRGQNDAYTTVDGARTTNY